MVCNYRCEPHFQKLFGQTSQQVFSVKRTPRNRPPMVVEPPPGFFSHGSSLRGRHTVTICDHVDLLRVQLFEKNLGQINSEDASRKPLIPSKNV